MTSTDTPAVTNETTAPTTCTWTIVFRLDDGEGWHDWSTGHRSVPEVLAAAEVLAKVPVVAEIRFDRITTVRERFSLADLGADRDAPPAAAQPEPTVRATRYEVSLLPEDDINHGLYALGVEARGSDRWAVVRHRQCLGTDGQWSWESIPSEREDEWLTAHRFDLDTALRLAKQAAPHVTVNGHTAADVLARRTAGEV